MTTDVVTVLDQVIEADVVATGDCSVRLASAARLLRPFPLANPREGGG